MFFLALGVLWLCACFTVHGGVVNIYNTSFTPGFSLRVSVRNITQGCSVRESVIVNGTSPGPTLHIKPNKVTWIRVYNDMADQNLTMVNFRYSSIVMVMLTTNR
jgi:L-ascorbate oxidase